MANGMGSLDVQKAHPEDARIEEARSKALELRIGGASYRQIAEALGVSRSTAHSYIVGALDELRAQNLDDAEELRRLEVSRLDRMLLALWPKNKEPRVVDTILRIMERRAKLLGLDAPARWEGSGPGGGPIPIAGGQLLDTGKMSVAELEMLDDLYERYGPKPPSLPPAPSPPALPKA